MLKQTIKHHVINWIVNSVFNLLYYKINFQEYPNWEYFYIYVVIHINRIIYPISYSLSKENIISCTSTTIYPFTYNFS